MREFKRQQGGALSRLPLASRRLYLGFLVLAVCAFASSVALYYDSLGLSPDGAVDYFLGNMDDLDAEEIRIEKSARELLEVTHFHLYTMPLWLLVLAHLFLMARGGRWKGWVVAGALAFTALHVAGPWIVRATGTGWVMGATGVPFLVFYLVMALWPIPELLGGADPGGGHGPAG